jgi:hypothetical protein
VYSAVYLVRAFIMADMLRSNKDLEDAVCIALQMWLPGHTAEALVEQVRSKQLNIPHHSTISRFRLCLDAGFMMLEQDSNLRIFGDTFVDKPLHELPALYLTADSSEQGGLDWELMAYTIIEPGDLLKLADNVNRLRSY